MGRGTPIPPGPPPPEPMPQPMPPMPVPPPQPMPQGPQMAPMHFNLDASRAMSDAMGQFMPQVVAGVEQNSAILAEASRSIAEASQAMAQAVGMLASSMDNFAHVLSADTELLRDPKTGRAVGARKVIQFPRAVG
jgi:hypothetical protein